MMSNSHAATFKKSLHGKYVDFFESTEINSFLTKLTNTGSCQIFKSGLTHIE